MSQRELYKGGGGGGGGVARRARAAEDQKTRSYATSCGTSSATPCATSFTCATICTFTLPSSAAPNTSSATSCATSFTCPSFTCLFFTCHLRASVGGGMRALGVGSKATLAANRTSSGVGVASGSPRAAAKLFCPLKYSALGGAGRGCEYVEGKVVLMAAATAAATAAAAAEVEVVVKGKVVHSRKLFFEKQTFSTFCVQHVLRHVLRHVLCHVLRHVLHVLVLHLSAKNKSGRWRREPSRIIGGEGGGGGGGGGGGEKLAFGTHTSGTHAP